MEKFNLDFLKVSGNILCGICGKNNYENFAFYENKHSVTLSSKS